MSTYRNSGVFEKCTSLRFIDSKEIPGVQPKSRYIINAVPKSLSLRTMPTKLANTPYSSCLMHVHVLTLRRSALLHVRWRQGLDVTRALAEPRAEDTVGILEHAVLETDDNELRALEACLDQATNVLGV